MGSLCQKEFVMNSAVPGCDANAVHVFNELGLTKSEVTKIYNVFLDIDLNKSGQVGREEFFAMIRVEATPFNKRVFRSCDKNGSHSVNFCEFVIAMWDLLSSRPEELGSFAFYLFDDLHSGFLTGDEIRNLVETIHHKSYGTNKGVHHEVDKLIATCSSKGLGVLAFVEWTHAHPTILGPVIQLQQHLWECVCGKRFWQNICARRIERLNQSAPGYIIGVYETYDANVFKDKIKSESKSTNKDTAVVVTAATSGVGGNNGRRKSGAKISPVDTPDEQGAGEIE